MDTGCRRPARPGALPNIGLAVGFALVLALAAHQYADEGRPWAFDCAVGVALCALALSRGRGRGRGRAAVAGLAVVAVAGVVARIAHLPREPGAAAILALFVLGGAAVRALPPRPAAGVALAGLGVLGVDWLAIDPWPHPLHSPLQLVAMGWVAAVVVGLWLRFLDERRRGAAEAVRRDERLLLARELHDVVAHHITGVVLQAQAARILGRRNPEALDGTLAAIEAAGTDALAATRRVVGVLRDADDGMTTMPAPEQLAELVRRFGTRGVRTSGSDEPGVDDRLVDGSSADGRGPVVRLRLPADDSPWPPEVTTTVYRIVQESLTNIARHAPHARSATVDVTRDRADVRVEITDDAPPGAARHPHRGGFGLIGMRERVEALGGTLDVGPRPGAGWSVSASLPVPARERR